MPMGAEALDDSALPPIRRITIASKVIVSDTSDTYSPVTGLRADAGGHLVRSAYRLAPIRAAHTVADGGAIFDAEAATPLVAYFPPRHAPSGPAAFPHPTKPRVGKRTEAAIPARRTGPGRRPPLAAHPARSIKSARKVALT
jgi:hypothetical protein